jgi:hypothetical protein
MDSGVRLHLSNFDIVDYPTIFEVNNPSLLVSNPKAIDESLAWANLIEPPMSQWKHYHHACWKGLHLTKHAVVFAYALGLEPYLPKCDTWLLHNMKVETPRGELHTDAIHVGLTSDSILIPWYANFSDQSTMVDLCCGGYGGWTYGARFAANLGWPKFRHIGIDNDLFAATQHAINHTTLFLKNTPIPLE